MNDPLQVPAPAGATDRPENPDLVMGKRGDVWSLHAWGRLVNRSRDEAYILEEMDRRARQGADERRRPVVGVRLLDGGRWTMLLWDPSDGGSADA